MLKHIHSALGCAAIVSLLSSAALSTRTSLATGNPDELLEKGIYLEETKGDLPGAIRVYEEIFRNPAAEGTLAAQARLRAGICELKSGNKGKAFSTLERFTQSIDKSRLLGLLDNHVPPLLEEVVHQIETKYVREVKGDELLVSAINAILGQLDQQSDYLTREDLAQTTRQLEQKFAGIGAKLKAEGGAVLVEGPLRGSPALKAGLKSGDQIVAVDGKRVEESTPGRELQETVQRITGKPGTIVALTLQRTGGAATEEIKIERAQINLPSIAGARAAKDGEQDYMLDAGRKIGYVHVVHFAKRTVEELKTAISGLLANGMSSLVLDLRLNPGGLLSEAVAVSDLFLETGTITSVRGRTGPAEIYTAKPEGTFPAFPIVLLINKETASAAEIVAGALQDNSRAILVGERTFGQGLVKQLIDLDHGKGALKLPTAAYYRPNGRGVHRFPNATEEDEWGVSPDGEGKVPMTKEEGAELRLHYVAVENGREADPFQDRVLNKAVDILSKR